MKKLGPRPPQRTPLKPEQVAEVTEKLGRFSSTLNEKDRQIIKRVINLLRSGELVVNPNKSPEEILESARRHIKL